MLRSAIKTGEKIAIFHEKWVRYRAVDRYGMHLFICWIFSISEFCTICKMRMLIPTRIHQLDDATSAITYFHRILMTVFCVSIAHKFYLQSYSDLILLFSIKKKNLNKKTSKLTCFEAIWSPFHCMECRGIKVVSGVCHIVGVCLSKKWIVMYKIERNIVATYRIDALKKWRKITKHACHTSQPTYYVFLCIFAGVFQHISLPLICSIKPKLEKYCI